MWYDGGEEGKFMANYTTHTSDKRKKTALVFWAVGLLGLLGLEYFYVGKVKKGISRFIIGIILLIALLNGTSEAVLGGIVCWVVAAVPNLVRIFLGTFRDNVGVPLRK